MAFGLAGAVIRLLPGFAPLMRLTHVNMKRSRHIIQLLAPANQAAARVQEFSEHCSQRVRCCSVSGAVKGAGDHDRHSRHPVSGCMQVHVATAPLPACVALVPPSSEWARNNKALRAILGFVGLRRRSPPVCAIIAYRL